MDSVITDNFILIKNFFSIEECELALNRFKFISEKTLPKDFKLDENKHSHEFKVGDIFFSKKKGIYEASKANLQLSNLDYFTEKIDKFIKDHTNKLYTFKIAQLVFKKNFDSENMPPHVDNIYDKSKFFLNFGIYLSNSDNTNGIYFYRDSSSLKLDNHVPNRDKLASFKKEYICASKGDLLIHNCYCVHESNSVYINEGRATLYIKAEFNENN